MPSGEADAEMLPGEEDTAPDGSVTQPPARSKISAGLLRPSHNKFVRCLQRACGFEASHGDGRGAAGATRDGGRKGRLTRTDHDSGIRTELKSFGLDACFGLFADIFDFVS